MSYYLLVEKATQDTSLQSRTGSSHRAYLFDRIWAIFYTYTYRAKYVHSWQFSLQKSRHAEYFFTPRMFKTKACIWKTLHTRTLKTTGLSKLTPDAPNTFTPGQYVTWIVSTVSKTVQGHPKPTRYYKIMSYITYMPLSLKAQHDPRSIRSGSVRRDFQGTGQWPTPWGNEK